MAGTSGTSETPCAVWDLTIPESIGTVELLKSKLNELFKRWVFQLEQGESTGYRHYQCRISVSPKKRQSAMIKYCKELSGCHVSRTSNNSKDDDFYVMKDETRVDGPWSNLDYQPPAYIQERFRGTITWKTWQRQLYAEIEPKADDRTINLILERNGNKGKSFIIAYLCQIGLARRIPPLPTAKDMSQFIMCFPPAKCYFIDLPRATSDRDQHAIYSTLETLKDGYIYETRHKGRDKWFEPPHVWVITNREPDINLLSKDRWRFWHIHPITGLTRFETAPAAPSTSDP